jgi:hypothetical protein
LGGSWFEASLGRKRKTLSDFISLLLEWLPSRTQATTNIGEDVWEKKPLYTAGGNVNKYNHYGKQFGGFSKN